ncbi:DUF5047 domain-containing protein [Streptomyces sp. NPDC050485]|uniref:DUF5047 domain-containing protein n=1 Tax=Streptomyces sp. NPDC050485 TaxID=3365617 RepID=UPI0037B991E6
MRPTSLTWPHVIPAAHHVAATVESWRSGVRLADRIPIVSGSITYDDTATLRRRVTLTVAARTPDGTVWDPGSNPAHPLAAYGQRLHIRAGIHHPAGQSELLDHGWYLITGWERAEDEGALTVTGVDLAQLLADARHYRTETPAKNNTYATEFTRLADNILPTVIDSHLPSRKVNALTVWDRDRTRNLDDLCDAWGARWYVDDQGQLAAAPAYAPVTAATPYQLRLVSGRNGTVVTRQRTGERGRLYNAVIATGKAGENQEPAPYAVAEITDPLSPIRVGGPWGRRPRFYQSDMLTTSADCLATARQLLVSASAISRTEPIQCVPDPAVELGDVAEVVTDGTAFRGRVTSLTLPLLASGPMSLTITNAPKDEESP